MANRISTVDKAIDYDSIAIEVNGRVNGSKTNKGQVSRWDGNTNKDGFIYTSSTQKQEDGSFNYRFTGINMGEDILNIKGSTSNDPDAVFRMASHYRDDASDEGIVNFVSAQDDNKTIKGTATEEGNFRYNEGNALINEDHPHPSIDGENTLPNLGSGYSSEKTSFFNLNAYTWVDELRTVRNLTK